MTTSALAEQPAPSRCSDEHRCRQGRRRRPGGRLRAFTVAAVIVVAVVAGPGSNAYAQEATEAPISHEAELCIQKLEGGGDVDECQMAPNKFLPVRDEIIWAVVSFAVLVVLLTKFALPVMKRGLASRTQRVRSELDTAGKARTDAETVLADYRAQLADARNDATRIIEEARRSADRVRADLEARAHADIAEMRARAHADIEAARSSAIADLRTEVAALAIGAAESIVQRNLDHDTQVQLVENFIRQVENRN